WSNIESFWSPGICSLTDARLVLFVSARGRLAGRSPNHRSKERGVVCEPDGGSGAHCAALLHAEYVWPSVVSRRERSCLHDQSDRSIEPLESFYCRRISDSTPAIGGSA